MTRKYKRATIVPVVWMRCPACIDDRAFEVTYSETNDGRRSLVDIKQNCSCHIPEAVARDLARIELRG